MKAILSESLRLNALIIGANRGIGLGFTESLLEDERVSRIIATFREEKTAKALKGLKKLHDDRLLTVKADVTDASSLDSAFKEIKGHVDVLDLVIYCAGLLHDDELSPEKSLSDINSQNLLRSFQVNSIGAVLSARYLTSLFKRDRPSIFACLSARVGSIGDNRLGGWYGYRASKAALNMFVKTISVEYSRCCPNTVVVSLHPGTTDTRLSKPFQRNVPEAQLSTIQETVGLLSNVLANLTLKDSGKFLSWDGTEVPW